MELLFDRIADVYSRTRPTYPQRLFALLAATAGRRRFPVAIDVGCGSGQSLAGLLGISDIVIGVEPSAPMRAEAATAYPGVTLLEGSGEAIGVPGATADLITVGNAFYWMDGPAALAEAGRVLRPGGVFATYKYDFPKIHLPAADRVLRAHLGQRWNVHRSRRLTDPDSTADLMRASELFSQVTTRVVPYTLQWATEEFVAFMSSTSYVSSYAGTLPDAGGYYRALTEELRAAGGDTLTVSLVLFVNIGVKRS